MGLQGMSTDSGVMYRLQALAMGTEEAVRASPGGMLECYAHTPDASPHAC